MNVEGCFAQAAGDRHSGACEIERHLIASLLEHRHQWTVSLLRGGAAGLVAGQPAMANLRRLAEMLMRRDLCFVDAAIRQRLTVLDRLGALLGRHGPFLLEGRTRVVTISRSSAVRFVLQGAAEAGWRGEVIVLDGTSSGCGQDQAEALADDGFAVSSWPDGAVCAALAGSAEVTLVLVGADAVGADRFVNSQGTRCLCELALTRGVDVVLVADSGKDLVDGELDALLAAAPVHRDDGPGRHWSVFEAVPLALVMARVDEHRTAGVR